LVSLLKVNKIKLNSDQTVYEFAICRQSTQQEITMLLFKFDEFRYSSVFLFSPPAKPKKSIYFATLFFSFFTTIINQSIQEKASIFILFVCVKCSTPKEGHFIFEKVLRFD